MTAPITRKRALELAQECVLCKMGEYYSAITQLGFSQTKQPEREAELNAKYAELAAALAWLENAARQGEMHL